VSRSKKFGDVVASPEEVSEAKTWIKENAGALKGLPIRTGSTDKEGRKEKRTQQSLTSAPDQIPVEEEDDTIVAGSDLYEIDGEVQTCVNCDVRLTVEDVKQDLKRCKKNDWDEPDEGFVCQKADCKKYRTSVSGYEADEKKEADERIIANDGKRQLEDKTVRGEEPLRDVIFATKHELGEVSTKREPGEVGVPAREERTDQEIYRDTQQRRAVILLPRCRKHGIPGCRPCNINEELAQHDKDHPEERTHNGLPKVATKAPWAHEAGRPRQLPLEKEVERILQQKRIKKLAEHPPKPSHEVRREQEQAWVKRTYDQYSLRRLHGYKRRQLAALFESPRFNPKRARVFTPGQVAFYKDLALGKTSTEVLEARIADGWYGRAGFERPDYLKRLEDQLVNHAWYIGLLEITPVTTPDDGDEGDEGDNDLDTSLEDKMIGRGGSDLSIIGSKYKSTPGKTFKTYGMSSFEQGVITRRVSGGSGGNSDRVADYDETAEEGD
jgi:hypothetical protein